MSTDKSFGKRELPPLLPEASKAGRGGVACIMEVADGGEEWGEDARLGRRDRLLCVCEYTQAAG